MGTPNTETQLGGEGSRGATAPRTRRAGELSYKFQRLRERLRQAVISGELAGKLPGERALARKYNCNAKTLSKALTDLAAEGLLDRSIGRGTYVKGSAPAEPEVGPWLVLGGGSELDSAVFRQLIGHNPRCQFVVGEPQSRPSFINQFSGVIDLSVSTPESFLRDLVIRGIPVVVMGREPRTYSLDSVLIDTFAGVQRLARELVQLGHRRFAAVEPVGHHEVALPLRQSLPQSMPMDVVASREVLQAVSNGATALICDNPVSAGVAVRTLLEAGVAVPATVSVVTVGIATGDETCSGAYVSLADVVSQAVRLLEDRSPRRPATLWLAPSLSDLGTMAGVGEAFRLVSEAPVHGRHVSMQGN